MPLRRPSIIAAGRSSRADRRDRFLGLSTALVIAGFCAASALTLHDLRRNTWERAISGETNLLNVLSQDIARNVEMYDLSLQAVVAGLKDPGLAALSPHLQDLVLYDGAASAKDLDSILVLDRGGKVVRGSRGDAVGAELGDREYFLAQKADPGRGLFISAPFTRRVTGHDDVIAFSHALRAADGSFDGVVVGTMRLDYFRRLFAEADVGPGGSIHLLRTDGASLMRVPYDADRTGRSFGASPVFAHFARARSGSFSARSTVNGTDRIFSYTRIGDLPLVLDVGFAADDVFAAWRARASTIVGALAVLCATAAGLALRLRRQIVRTERAQDLLERSEAQYRLLADHAQDVIVRLDRSLRRTYVSPAIRAMLGYEPEDLLGQGLGDIVHPEDWPEVAVLVGASQADGRNTEATYRLRHRDGHHVWVEGRYSPTPGNDGFVVVLRDIGRRKAAEEQLERLNAELARAARTDALTGLANRRAFDEALESAWGAAAAGGRPLSLLLIDVDRFKAFNDRYGHPEGDACLRAVADAVAGAVRQPVDVAARYGGEEIAVVLPDADGPEAARSAERIRAAVERLGYPHEGNRACGGVVTASLGAATMTPAAGNGPADLVALADARLYEAKRTGRNRVVSASGAPAAGLPAGEAERLDALARLEEAGAARPSDSLDAIARLTAQLFDMPVAFVSLVGREEAVLVGRHNFAPDRAPRDAVPCAHTIRGDEPFVVPSMAADPRFSRTPLAESGVGFYAGAPLVSRGGGHRLGALCILDHRARPMLDDAQRRLLAGLAGLVSDDLDRRVSAAEGAESAPRRRAG